MSSLLLAGLLAYIIDKKYYFSALFSVVLALFSFIGMIHADAVALFPKVGVTFGVIYLVVAVILVVKGYLFRNQNQEQVPSPEIS